MKRESDAYIPKSRNKTPEQQVQHDPHSHYETVTLLDPAEL